jgi:glycosyltransferase involved in cell wall biosynthesis
MVSIIIPCKQVDSYVQRCIKHIRELDYKDWEVVLVTDTECSGLPAEKRNYGIKKAKGDVIAFIDSDAYPRRDWLNDLHKTLLWQSRYGNDINFYYDIAAVCGPGILPPDASLREKATDLVLRWLPFSYRVVPKRVTEVPEYPTFNLIVRKEILDKVGKFERYLTGEDSLLCMKIRQYGTIMYYPDLVVYHNRRELFKPYFKQISVWGWHRGRLISLALVGWLGTCVVYPWNFLRGFLTRREYGR